MISKDKNFAQMRLLVGCKDTMVKEKSTRGKQNTRQGRLVSVEHRQVNSIPDGTLEEKICAPAKATLTLLPEQALPAIDVEAPLPHCRKWEPKKH